jgi:ribonuclease-3
LFSGGAERPVSVARSEQEARTLADFQQHFQLRFSDPDLLKLALTHRSYLSVTGQGPRESNERLEFLGDSVLGLVTSEFLYRRHPDEHEGELTKNKSLLVSKAILSRRALAMGLGRFVLMSHSEVESGGRQRLSILADAFESVLGAVYLDQGFEAAREFIHRWLLREAGEIVADKRHTNYKSHLQEYVQSTWRTHPVYRIRSEMGPDHSKHFLVEVMVGKRTLGEGRGRNKKEAEQAAARDALEKVGAARAESRAREAAELEETGHEAHVERTASREMADLPRESRPAERTAVVDEREDEDETPEERRRRRGRRGGRGRRERGSEAPAPVLPVRESRPEPESGPPPRLAAPIHRLGTLPPAEDEVESVYEELEPLPPARDEDEHEEIGRPEGPLEERHVDPYAMNEPREPVFEPQRKREWEQESPPEFEKEEEPEFDEEEISEEFLEIEEEAETSEADEPETIEPSRVEREPRAARESSPAAEPERAIPEPPAPDPAPETPASFGRRRTRR